MRLYRELDPIRRSGSGFAELQRDSGRARVGVAPGNLRHDLSVSPSVLPGARMFDCPSTQTKEQI